MVELKEGAYYRMRNGEIVGPILRGSPYAAFCFQNPDGSQLSWTRTGYYWNSGHESELDLVELVSEPIRPKSGGYYRMRNGDTIGPVHWTPFIDTARPYAASRGDKFALRWTEKGNQWLSGFPGEFDLVEELKVEFNSDGSLRRCGIPKRPPEPAPEPEPEPERLFYVPVSGYVGVFADSAEDALKIAGDVLDEMLDENDLVEISGPPVEN